MKRSAGGAVLGGVLVGEDAVELVTDSDTSGESRELAVECARGLTLGSAGFLEGSESFLGGGDVASECSLNGCSVTIHVGDACLLSEEVEEDESHELSRKLA